MSQCGFRVLGLVRLYRAQAGMNGGRDGWHPTNQ